MLLQVCKSMMDYFPSAILYPSREFHGRTPLHTIPSRGLVASNALPGRRRDIFENFLAGIESVIEKYPSALHLVDDYGLTPLHCFLFSSGGELLNCDLGTKRSVLAARLMSPTAARIASNEGKLPLHTALEFEVDILDELCEAAPETLERREPDNFLYPFLMAKDVSTSYKLLRMAPHIISIATSALSHSATTTVHVSPEKKRTTEAKEQDAACLRAKRLRTSEQE